MSVTVTLPVSTPYTPNGVTTAFPFDFKIGSTAEIAVYQVLIGTAVLVDSSLYSVSIAVDGEGGTVNFFTAPASGSGTIYLVGDPNFTQTANFTGSGPFTPTALNSPIDRNTLLALILKRRMEGSIRVPITETLDELPGSNGRAGKLIGFTAGTGVLDLLSYSALATTLAPLMPGTPGIQGPGTDLALQVDGTASGDGATNDTAAIQAVLNSAAAFGRRVRFGAKRYGITTLSIPAGVVIETAGFGTTFYQLPGTAANTRLLVVTGSNVTIGDCTLEGQLNQPGDTTGEQNHGILVQATATTGDLENVHIGNVKGTNIRGDVVYFGAQPGYFVSEWSVGDVLCNNVYRIGAAVTGGARGGKVGNVDGATAGLYVIDVEPNNGENDVTGIEFGRVYGRCASCNGFDALLAGISFKAIDLSPTNGPGSTPPYPVGVTVGLSQRNALVRTDFIRLVGFPSYGLAWLSSGDDTPELFASHAEIYGNSTSAPANGSVQSNARLRFDILETKTTLGTESIFVSCNDVKIGECIAELFTGSKLFSACSKPRVNDLTVTKPAGDTGSGGIIFASCTRPKVYGGSVDADRLFSFGSDGRAVDMDLTLATGAVTGSTGNSRLYGCKVNGTAWELLSYNGTTVSASIDGTGALIATGSLTVNSGYVNTSTGYRIGNAPLITGRKSGWALDTGTADRGSHATYTVGATLSFGATYTQSELTATATRIAAMEASIQANSRAIKALKDDLHTTSGGPIQILTT